MNDEDKESGRIFAFSDPTGRYREIELDFAKDTGALRSVFVYPWKMTWTECRRFGAQMSNPRRRTKDESFIPTSTAASTSWSTPQAT